MGIDDRPNGIRPDRLLHGWQAPVQPIPAATVILVRAGQSGLEIMMTRRSTKASFAPGAYVFPGGRLDEADITMARELAPDADDPESVQTTACAIAAIRESFEELGILIARDAEGNWPDPQAVLQLDRSAGDAFARALQTLQLKPALDGVHWFTHWVTDRDLLKRFDTRFYLAPTPPGQQPVADEAEQFEPVWVSPADALERHQKGQFELVFPTYRTLRHLSNYADADSLLAFAARVGTPDGPRRWQSSPRAGLVRGEVQRFSENETAYGELEMVTPDGRILHELAWQHEPVRLLTHLTRITAPNPSPMTGPGTNTYVISDGGEHIVIDPGPDHAGHLEQIASVITGSLRAIVCTHSHPDHFPGAKPLRELLGRPDAPILGRRAGPHFNPAWVFEPDRELQDDEVLRCGTETLRVLHTPGHASNHVCLLLEADGLLFSGDHILNGSTTVIDHPDGNMLDYMNALHRLRQLPLRYILPAHGYVLGNPAGQIDALVAHRLRREAKVLEAVRSAGHASTDELVTIAYDDVARALHPVARRSLTAHLMKLREEGTVLHDAGSDQWAMAG